MLRKRHAFRSSVGACWRGLGWDVRLSGRESRRDANWIRGRCGWNGLEAADRWCDLRSSDRWSRLWRRERSLQWKRCCRCSFWWRGRAGRCGGRSRGVWDLNHRNQQLDPTTGARSLLTGCSVGDADRGRAFGTLKFDSHVERIKSVLRKRDTRSHSIETSGSAQFCLTEQRETVSDCHQTQQSRDSPTSEDG